MLDSFFVLFLWAFLWLLSVAITVLAHIYEIVVVLVVAGALIWYVRLPTNDFSQGSTEKEQTTER